ncbi:MULTISPECIES: VOC family protein [Comamonas]|jgi:catechol 2,3-dioxygenase-like lactoylglutathione lyase family enzyme|uniref:VOC family protein n=1 Tax=Comamonas sediminis TaxID=1783360 RepID=A0ABV4B4W5_9BURK|nr:VOC family protein [Comamonas sp.]
MFSHIMLGTSDLEKSRQFYDAFLAELGVPPGAANKNRYFWRGNGGTFSVSTPINGEAASIGNGSTTGFAASSTEQVDKAHAVGVAHGGVACEDPPGWRGEGPAALYLAYLRDPDGNKLCLAYRQPKV